MAAGPESVTVTPGSTPPWASVTLPTSSPNIWPVCAAAEASPNANTMARAARARRIARVTDDLLKSALEFVPVAENDTLLFRAVVHKSCPVGRDSAGRIRGFGLPAPLPRAV